MHDRRIDAVIASSLCNVTYTSGCLMAEEPLSTFVMTSVEGKQSIIINEADAHYFRRQSPISDIRDYRFQATTSLSIESAVEHLVEMLLESGLGGARIGFEMQSVPAAVFTSLLNVADFRIEDATPVFERARLIKTHDEIDLLRTAADRTAEAIRASFASAAEGDSEAELTAAIQCRLLQFGASALAHGRALAGVHSTVAHAWPSTRPLADGEVIHVDFGAHFAGYCSDIGRNGVVGRARPEQNSRYRRLHAICWEAVDAIRPGTTSGELYERCERAMAAANLVYPWGTYGHSIGLSGHEGFEITKGGQDVLRAGMVINVEPSHIEAGDARYQVEETVAVTERGAEPLSAAWSPDHLVSIGV